MVPTDTSLLRSWLDERDADAFAELVERYSGMVFATARRILRDAGLAEDVAQECFLKLGRLDNPRDASLGALLHTMATREALKRLDSDTRRRRREDSYAKLTRKNQEPVWDDVAPHVDEAIAALPASLHRALVARYLEGKTYVAIAQSLKLDESTIRHRTQKAIDEVRKALHRKGITLGAAVFADLLAANAMQAAPAALTSTLGAAAIVGMTGAPTLTTTALVGGMIMWKKIALVAGIAALLAGSWTATSRLVSGPESDTLDIAEIVELEEPERSQQSAPTDEVVSTTEPVETTSAETSIAPTEEENVNASLTDLPGSLAEFLQQVASSTEKPFGRSFTSDDIPKDNAAHYFMLAYEMMERDDLELFIEKWTPGESPGDLLDDPEIMEMLERMRPMLEVLREGLKVGNAMLPEPESGPYEALPYLSYWRNFARMMTIEARLFEDDGNYDAAITNYLEALEFDTETGRGGTLIGGLVGYSGNLTVLDGLQGLIESGEVDPLAYPELIAQLNALEEESLKAVDLQIVEAQYFDTWMIRQLQEGGTFGSFLQDTGLEIELPPLSEEEFQAYFDEFLGHRAQVIEMSTLPYYEAQAIDMDALINGNPISQVLLPSIPRIMNTATNNQNGIRGTTTMAALNWYHAENGAYPATLEGLVPGYLPEFPTDLYTGEPFLYEATEGDYTLYSTGFDMEDNEGVAGGVRDPGTDMVFHQPPPDER